MTKRSVIKIHRGGGENKSQEFNLKREMIPELAADWGGADFIREYRERAWEAFKSIPLPNTKDEAWRRTDLRSMPIREFHSIHENGKSKDALSSPSEELLQPMAGETYAGQIIFSPNSDEKNIRQELIDQGVIFTDLATAERDHANVLKEMMGQVIRPDEGKFAAIASAMARQGVVVYIPPNVQVELPLHSFFWGPGKNLAYSSHLLVWVGEGASLTYVHESASPSGVNGGSLHTGLVEIRVDRAANLRFVELQSWGDHMWNFTHERAKVGQDATLDWIFGAVGSHLTKNFSDIDLVGRGATGKMSGFYFTDGIQHLDHDTQQNHLAPDTTSDLLFKGALKGHSRSVWQGMIYVAKGAQKTDGYQANRNLVLSSEARADSIPGLEIMADDVRCTHGATVGKIDPEQVFYLRSRGIPYDEAERLIVEGFFDPIMQRIPFVGVRNRFHETILEKMG